MMALPTVPATSSAITEYNGGTLCPLFFSPTVDPLMNAASLIRLSLVAAILLMFSQTVNSIFALAQTLDRVTADKVAQIASID